MEQESWRHIASFVDNAFLDLALHNNWRTFNVVMFFRSMDERSMKCKQNDPDSKVHGAYMGPTWGRQDPGGSHVGPINLAITEMLCFLQTPSIHAMICQNRTGIHPMLGPAFCEMFTWHNRLNGRFPVVRKKKRVNLINMRSTRTSRVHIVPASLIFSNAYYNE